MRPPMRLASVKPTVAGRLVLPRNAKDRVRPLGRPAREVIARATTPEIARQLEAETESARQLGVFGSPTFAVGAELFWRDDRLEDALAHTSSA
jgi:2-hydroxychromene-2-carboxylate isomerase